MEIHGHRVTGETGEGEPHGGMLRVKGGFYKTNAQIERSVEQLVQSIGVGLSLLESGQSAYAPDARPIPGAEIEMFDYVDAETGEHVTVWRVACQG